VSRISIISAHLYSYFNKTKEVMDHGKITAGSEKGSQEAEEQKEVGAS
jgi:hypothetical protein